MALNQEIFPLFINSLKIIKRFMFNGGKLGVNNTKILKKITAMKMLLIQILLAVMTK